MVSVDVKHHVYLLTYPCTSKHTELPLFFSSSPNGIYAGISLGSVFGHWRVKVCSDWLMCGLACPATCWCTFASSGIKGFGWAGGGCMVLVVEAYGTMQRTSSFWQYSIVLHSYVWYSFPFGILSKHVTGRLMNTVTKGGWIADSWFIIGVYCWRFLCKADVSYFTEFHTSLFLKLRQQTNRTTLNRKTTIPFSKNKWFQISTCNLQQFDCLTP